MSPQQIDLVTKFLPILIAVLSLIVAGIAFAETHRLWRDVVRQFNMQSELNANYVNAINDMKNVLDELQRHRVGGNVTNADVPKEVASSSTMHLGGSKL